MPRYHSFATPPLIRVRQYAIASHTLHAATLRYATIQRFRHTFLYAIELLRHYYISRYDAAIIFAIALLLRRCCRRFSSLHIWRRMILLQAAHSDWR